MGNVEENVAFVRRYRAAFTTFYLRVWLLFFLEYAIVPVSCLAG